jgi:signal transduction histidine kinase/CRP-like cAMP-binding protein
MELNDKKQDKVYSKLRANKMFMTVPTEQLYEISYMFREENYSPGDYIFREGDTDNALCLVGEGLVSITKTTSYGDETELSVLDRNDFFGELELLDGLPRSANCKALVKTNILKLDYDTFHSLLSENNSIALNVLRQLSARLRKADEAVINQLEFSRKKSQMRIDRLTALIDAARKVNSSLDLDELLQIILETATDGTRADRGTLYLIDYSRGEIWSKVLQGDAIEEIRLPLGKGIAGYVAQTGDVIYTENAYKDPRFNPEIDCITGYHTRSMLCMPMRNRYGKIIGVFQLLNKSTEPFRKEDEEFIDALSAHASIAIENARVAQEMILNERLSTVGTMAGSILHDIKSPMNTIKLHTEALRNISGNEEAAGIAGEVIEQIDRLVNMVQEILDFSRGVSSMNMKKVEIGKILDRVLGFLEKDIQRQKLKTDRQMEYTGYCVLDPDKIERVFYNLASNAIDAMADGGTLSIATTTFDDKLQVIFRDTGRGIPKEIRARIFDPFFTFGKKHGTGLGMAIVKKIIEDHNGIIDFETAEGKGTTFYIYLPLRLTTPFL